jgi:diketogulonate reductase-like aldo/keto reductase
MRILPVVRDVAHLLVQSPMLPFTGWGMVRNDPVIRELAKKYTVSPTQVILSWHLAREIPIVAKSADKERQKENFAVCYNKLQRVLQANIYQFRRS